MLIAGHAQRTHRIGRIFLDPLHQVGDVQQLVLKRNGILRIHNGHQGQVVEVGLPQLRVLAQIHTAPLLWAAISALGGISRRM